MLGLLVHLSTACTHTHARAHMRARTHTHTRACTYTHTRARARTHTRARARTHTHTQTHVLAHRKGFKIINHRHLPNTHLSVHILVVASLFLQKQDLEVRPWFRTQASGQRFPYTISAVQWLTRTSFLQGQ